MFKKTKNDPSQDLSRYAHMQKAYYDDTSADVEEIVGNYDYHENFPYETHLLHLYGDLRKPVLADMRSARGFEIGCGEGRMIRRMARMLGQVDGADISEKMVGSARIRTPGAQVFLSSGLDCGAAQSGSYDFAYCAISMQHICVYETRASIISDIVRILKPDGCATLQFFFSKYYPYCRTMAPPQNESFLTDIHHVDRLHAQWFDNRWDAIGTNSACDVAFGTRNIPEVLTDFKQWFKQADVWFHDISIGRPEPRGEARPRILSEVHPNCHGFDDAWFTHMAFFHLRGPKK
ncbi:MAG: class I SAM-dependent methyltransferase [Pseudomonadota bacterium]